MRSATYDLINESEQPLTIHRIILEGPVISMVVHGSKTHIPPGGSFALEVKGRVALDESDLDGCAITVHTDQDDMPVLSFPLNMAEAPLGFEASEKPALAAPLTHDTADAIKGTLYPYLKDLTARERGISRPAPSPAIGRKDDTLLLSQPEVRREAPAVGKRVVLSGDDQSRIHPHPKKMRRPRGTMRRIALSMAAGVTTYFSTVSLFNGIS